MIGRAGRWARALIAIAPIAATGAASAAPVTALGAPAGPSGGEATSYGLSEPVRDLPSATAEAEGPVSARVEPEVASGSDQPTDSRDPLAGAAEAQGERAPVPDLVFNGVGNPLACATCTPPDTIGDVGPSHYIQMVNATKVAIFDKAGTPLAAPFDLGTLWSSSPADPCTGNRGDPVVVYDEFADRWLLSQFFGDPGMDTGGLCFAISETADPLGSYHLYTFDLGVFPDYFKVGAWPTGYYVSANEASYTAYAFDRSEMLAGDPAAGFVKFAGETNFLLPADVDGPTAPESQGGLFYTFKDGEFPPHGGGGDRLELFRLVPDFTTPGASTFARIDTIPVASFAYTVCGFFEFECVRQQGTTRRIDTVSEWPMWRFAYRRFPGREVLLGNFTVGGGTGEVGAAIRWFELRNEGSGWQLFQEGTHAGSDGHDRFMGSIAMDRRGEIALGFSVSSSTMFPAIRYATRDPADQLGTLGPERTMVAGGGSQIGSPRWGDYSAMSVDPADDCGFWYTNEYYGTSSLTTWSTAVGRFEVPECAQNPSLTVRIAGGGSGTVTGPGISCPGDCTESYPEGTAVSLAATPAPGSAFGGFSGDCTGGACSLVMGPSQAVTAGFFATGGDGGGAGADGGADGGGTNQPPSNEIRILKPKLNKKKGTAKLPVRVFAPGELVLRGRKIRRRVKDGGPGKVRMPVRPKGKTAKKLDRNGKAKVRAAVTFTPTGGVSNTERKTIKLKQR